MVDLGRDREVFDAQEKKKKEKKVARANRKKKDYDYKV